MKNILCVRRRSRLVYLGVTASAKRSQNQACTRGVVFNYLFFVLEGGLDGMAGME